MAIKKTELYSSLWASCDELRGGMDASQYKDYVLTFLFLKYVSDKSTGSIYDSIEVPAGTHFDDIIALKNDKEIGDKLNKIIGKLAEINNLKNVIDIADFNDEEKLGKGKEMVDRLTKLVGIFQGLELGDNRAEHDDLLGDAYEYLMRHFATDSGKSKGQFYTPSEVSRILAKVVGIKQDSLPEITVYDPTCGSGSLLLKAFDESANGLSIFGQEMDNATAALSRMNMILHDNSSAKIVQGNTLSTPEFKNDDGALKTFDFAVANPPFSVKSWDNGINVGDDRFKRFEYGIPPDKNGDYAFLLHILKSLKSTGKGAVILPHGVLFRGNAEARIRENLIKQGVIKGIIGLAANLFYGTGIPACIIVLDKEHAGSRKGIFMLDASKGFIKDGNKNRLREQDIHKVVDLFTKQVELTGFSRMVNVSEVVANEYNLNIPRYIDSSDAEDLHDLSAHLSGGIPSRDIGALSTYWNVLPTLKKSLFKPVREGYEAPLVKASDVKNTILAHAEFKAFAKASIELLIQWQTKVKLDDLAVGDKPKAIIHRISEQLLNQYAEAKLLDKYDIFQILMDYWQEILQDDVYVITQDGWIAGNNLRKLLPQKDSKGKDVYTEQSDFVLNKIRYKGELIPTSLIINRYFKEEKEHIEKLVQQFEYIKKNLEEIIEVHGAEDMALCDLKDGDKKLKKADVLIRIKELETVVVSVHNKPLKLSIESISEEINDAECTVNAFEQDENSAVFLNPLNNAKGKLTKTNVSKRLKVLLTEVETTQEQAVLSEYIELLNSVVALKKQQKSLFAQRTEFINNMMATHSKDEDVSNLLVAHECFNLMEQESQKASEIKIAETTLYLKVVNKYPTLEISEIKTLVVEDKWHATLHANITAEIERVTQQLTNRVKTLEERYAEPLPKLTENVSELACKVDEHLKTMGLSWQSTEV